jgi:valyl-tRNA synthetase
MSKSKGNVVDPLGLIDEYGADALRFFMAAMESQGRDIKMDESRVEGYRNFATKLWNATRFCQANGIGASRSIAAPPATSAVNKWIVGEVVDTVATLDKAMAELRFDAAANAIYHFVWDTFCDWYLELIKADLQSPTGKLDTSYDWPRREETRQVAGWALDQILVMLHPFMPFVTEELWHAQGERKGPAGEPWPLITAKWPKLSAAEDKAAKAQIEFLQEFVVAIRSIRAEYQIPWSQRLTIHIAEPDEQNERMLFSNAATFVRLTKTYIARFGSTPEEMDDQAIYVSVDDNTERMARAGEGIQFVIAGQTYLLLTEGIIDIAAEQSRLAKARETALKERDSLARRLDNPAFVEKAKPEAVEKARADHAHHAAEAERLEAALARLG